MSAIIDEDAILSKSEQWTQLDQKWGTPVDLDTEDDCNPIMKTVFSTLDLMMSTFDSSFLFKKVRRNLSKNSTDYKEFLQDLNMEDCNTPKKQFYYISGQILSAESIEDICNKIDDIFKSVDNLSSATSTLRIDKLKNRPGITQLPDVVHCSISTSDLSFDDTVENLCEREKSDTDDIDRYIDEVFSHLNSSLVTLSNENLGGSLKESVTSLVRGFTDFLKSPDLKCSPRQRRECSDRFKDLINFWQNQASEKGT